MSDKQTPAPETELKAQAPTDADQDVEGHNLWVNPSASYEMTKARNKDIERQAREHARQKETRTKGK